jgi:glycosyltransferase involved in cell wall biosynthesis
MSRHQIRILHFAQDSDTSGFFPQLAKWHDRDRFKMYFATLNPMAPWLEEQMVSEGVTCFSCRCHSRIEFLLGIMKLARFLRRERIGIIHAHLFEPSVVGLLAGALAGTPMRVLTRHHSDYHTRIGKKWHVRLDQLCTGLSHKVIAVSDHTARHLLEVEKAPGEKVSVVMNGIDFDRVKVSGGDARANIRKEFGCEDKRLLIIVARLHPEKGHHYLFQALPEIRRRSSKPVRLLVAGAGTFDAAYREEVTKADCGDMVSFLGFRKDSADLIAAADLLILPSLAEAFGLVLTEALYLGTPIVASGVGGIPEIVSDGVDGVLVPAADSSALADAIVRLLEDSAERDRLAGAGRDRVIKRFRFEEMVRSYEVIYTNAAGARGEEPSGYTGGKPGIDAEGAHG